MDPTGRYLACIKRLDGQLLLPEPNPLSGNYAYAAYANVAVIDKAAGSVHEYGPVLMYTADWSWSSDGRHAAYYVTASNVFSLPLERTLMIIDESGNVVFQVENARGGAWSADGSRFAFRREAEKTAVIYDLSTGQESVTGADVLPTHWVLDDSAMVVGTDLQFVPSAGVDVPQGLGLLDFATGAIAGLPARPINEGWYSPDGRRAFVFAGNSERAEDGLKVAVLDFASLSVDVLEGTGIAYPSEGIPTENFRFSPDGETFVWADVTGSESRVFRGNPDQTFDLLSQWSWGRVAFSEDLSLIARQGGGGLSITSVFGPSVYNVDIPVAEGKGPPYAWRPRQ